MPGTLAIMSKSQRDKGLRAEREIVDRHKAINVHAERFPLSGASRFRGSGHDVDLYWLRLNPPGWPRCQVAEPH
jgi:hypothetical protein